MISIKINKRSKLLYTYLSIFVLLFLLVAFFFNKLPIVDEALVKSNQIRQVFLEKYDSYVHFIDVGQGDSTFIKSGAQNILIDGGDNHQEENLVKYLKDLGVKTVDYIIATHPHADHIGGLDAVIDNFDVKNIISPKLRESLVPTTKSYTDFLNSIKKKNLKITQPVPDDHIYLSGSDLHILGPIGDYNDLNNMSVSLKYNYNEKLSFFIAGDIEKESEKDLANKYKYSLKSSVVKLSHHGSSSSNTLGVLKLLNPDYFVVSAGSDNKYGHPHSEVVERLNKPLYQTSKNGTIIFGIYDDGFEIFIDQ